MDHAESGGTVRACTRYTIGLMNDGAYQTEICAVLADDLSEAASADRHYQRQTVLRHVFTKLESGWSPAAGPLLPLVIPDPAPGYRPRRAPHQTYLDRVLGRLR